MFEYAEFDPDRLVIKLSDGNRIRYEVDLARCEKCGEVLDWIFQLLDKNWVTPEVMHSFLQELDRASEKVFGSGIQGVLCSYGASKEVNWKTKKWDRS